MSEFDRSPSHDVTCPPQGLFFVERQGGKTWVGHGGTQNAFVSRLTFNPDIHTGYLFVVNTIGDPSSKDQKGDTTTLNREVRD